MYLINISKKLNEITEINFHVKEVRLYYKLLFIDWRIFKNHIYSSKITRK